MAFIVIGLVTALILLLTTPGEVYAWGPVTHLAHGATVLQQINNLPMALQEILRAHTDAYLYGCVGADIINAIERREIIHQGTFNANPLSAAAGTTALRLIATQPVNAKADAAAERLRDGLNNVFARLEIPGHAYGIASAVHTRIGISAEVDEYGIIQGDVQGTPLSDEADHQLAMAMYNNGIDSHRRFLTAMTHDDDLVDRTLQAFEQSLEEVRREGLL